MRTTSLLFTVFTASGVFASQQSSTASNTTDVTTSTHLSSLVNALKHNDHKDTEAEAHSTTTTTATEGKVSTTATTLGTITTCTNSTECEEKTTTTTSHKHVATTERKHSHGDINRVDVNFQLNIQVALSCGKCKEPVEQLYESVCECLEDRCVTSGVTAVRYEIMTIICTATLRPKETITIEECKQCEQKISTRAEITKSVLPCLECENKPRPEPIVEVAAKKNETYRPPSVKNTTVKAEFEGIASSLAPVALWGTLFALILSF